MPRMLAKRPGKGRKESEYIEYFVKDQSKDFHCEFGFVTKEDLNKPDGSLIKTNMGTELHVFSPSFLDAYKQVARGPQMIPLKDIGPIITYCGLGKESIVVEGGAGSGGLSCVLAHVCKEVISYDINEEHIKLVNKNKELLNLKNLKIKNQDMTKKIDEQDVDAVILDLPSPWFALDAALIAVKIGGIIVSYSPNISQVVEFCKSADEKTNVARLFTIETVEREWVIDSLISHPRSRAGIHSGFLTFIRRLS